MTKTQSRLRDAVSLGDPAAGNGILNRRIFLEGALVSGAVGVGVPRVLAEPLTVQSWMKEPGAGFTQPDSNVRLGSETAVPARRRRDRSASISGPPAETALQATARR